MFPWTERRELGVVVPMPTADPNVEVAVVLVAMIFWVTIVPTTERRE